MSSQRSNRGHLYHWWLISVTEEDVRVKLDHFKICYWGIGIGIINAMVHNNWSFRSDLAEAVEQRKVLVTLLSFIQVCQWRNIPIKFLKVKIVTKWRWIIRQMYVIICTILHMPLLNFENQKRKNRSQSLQEWFWHYFKSYLKGQIKTQVWACVMCDFLELCIEACYIFHLRINRNYFLQKLADHPDCVCCHFSLFVCSPLIWRVVM